jgi:DNA-binding NtrC family response regulator
MSQDQTGKNVIILVDDNEDMLQIFRAYLVKKGYNVHAFSDPKTAYEHIRYAPREFSILVSDIRMPGMSGFELAKITKAVNSEIKIILMTAFDLTIFEVKEILPSIEIVGILEKPFQLEKLDELLKGISIQPSTSIPS